MKAPLSFLLMLVAASAVGQVRVLPLDSSGVLSWTNRIGPGLDEPFPNDTVPVYRVDSANSITGLWTALTNTSETSVVLPNFASNAPASFYRVVWTNGQVWNYRAYSGDTLIVTGKLYLSWNQSYVDGGAFNLVRVASGIGATHRIGANTLDSCLDCEGRIHFAPYCCDNEFMLDGFNATSGVSTGVWYSGGFAGQVEQGVFVAERLSDGK